MKAIPNYIAIAAFIILIVAQPSAANAQNCMSECNYGDLNACTQCQQAAQRNSYQQIQQQSNLRQMRIQQELDQMQQRQHQRQMNQPRQVTCQVSGGTANCMRW